MSLQSPNPRCDDVRHAIRLVAVDAELETRRSACCRRPSRGCAAPSSRGRERRGRGRAPPRAGDRPRRAGPGRAPTTNVRPLPTPVGRDVEVCGHLGHAGHALLAHERRHVGREEVMRLCPATRLFGVVQAAEARLIEEEVPRGRRDQHVVDTRDRREALQDAQVAVVVREQVGVRDVVDAILDLDRVADLERREDDHERARVVVDPVPRLAELLLERLRGGERRPIAADDPRGPHVDALGAGIELDRVHPQLTGAFVVVCLGRVLMEARAEAVLEDRVDGQVLEHRDRVAGAVALVERAARAPGRRTPRPAAAPVECARGARVRRRPAVGGRARRGARRPRRRPARGAGAAGPRQLSGSHPRARLRGRVGASRAPPRSGRAPRRPARGTDRSRSCPAGAARARRARCARPRRHRVATRRARARAGSACRRNARRRPRGGAPSRDWRARRPRRPRRARRSARAPWERGLRWRRPARAPSR